MPSQRHEVLLELFRARITLAPELLKAVFRVPIPDGAEVQPAEANLTQLIPTELNADLVLLLGAPKPAFGVVVEVQLGRDPDKPFAWPLYAAALRRRHRCPVAVLVVAPDPGIARWARRPIALGAGNEFRPLVLGPAEVPVVERRDEADRCPELAVLSAIAHARDPERAAKVAFTALRAVEDLDDNHRAVYYDLIQASLGGDIRKELTQMAFGEVGQNSSQTMQGVDIAQGKQRP